MEAKILIPILMDLIWTNKQAKILLEKEIIKKDMKEKADIMKEDIMKEDKADIMIEDKEIIENKKKSLLLFINSQFNNLVFNGLMI